MKKLTKTIYRNCPICENEFGHIFQVVNGYNIIRCTKCEMVYVDLDLVIAEKENQLGDEAFDFYYMSEPIYTLAYYDLMLEKIQKHFNNKNIKILEFGCGSGMFMRRAVKKNIDIYGLDFSPYSKKAKELFNLQIDTNALSNTIYSENQFDVIISHCTYEHLYSPLETTQKLLKLLNKNGLFIISGVPNFNTITINVFKNFYNNKPPVHVNHFEIKSLKKLINAAKLETIHTKSYGWNIWFIWFRIKAFLFQKNKNSGKNPNLKITKRINTFTNFDASIIHRTIAKLYYNLVFPGIGKNLEIWGVFKDQEKQ
ncbi:MAG TPA: hypothetical protein DCQ31_15950 [Bacteroidales bacterium]|nr:hypothetical protein [Bacteroidales bacterium]